jgi:hypothetical protein
VESVVVDFQFSIQVQLAAIVGAYPKGVPGRELSEIQEAIPTHGKVITPGKTWPFLASSWIIHSAHPLDHTGTIIG